MHEMKRLVFININCLGGTGSYMLAMSSSIAAQGDGGSTPMNVKRLNVGWMIGFLFAVSFVGLFSIMPLRKVWGENISISISISC